LFAGHLVDHAAIAALDQHVGDALAEPEAARDGEQVFLALGAGVLNQVGLVQRERVNEHRPGHRDGVVERQRAHQLRRGIVDRGEPPRQPGARLQFDVGAKLQQHVVEQRDLLAGIAARAGREQIGDPLENAAARILAGCERGIDLVDQRLRSGCAGISSAGGRGLGHGECQPNRKQMERLGFACAARVTAIRHTLAGKYKNPRHARTAKR
jgi:hypothetical protein